MTDDIPSEATVRIVMQGGQPTVETRIRTIGPVAAGPRPGGKILVLRIPIPTTMGEEEAWEMSPQEIIDDGSLEAFCPECASGGHDVCSPEPPPWMRPSPAGGAARCPCGSGEKDEKCGLP